MTLISIIIPSYNSENLISKTIESVLDQTYSIWELIIVDDGSSDYSYEVIKTFSEKDSRIRTLQRDRVPKGPSTCRNIGVKKSKGEYIVFLDSDDLLAKFCLEQRLNFMIKKPNLDFAVFNIELFNTVPGDLGILFNQYPKWNDSYLKMFLRNENPWQTMGPIWKRDSFEKLKGFNEDLIIMEDPELHTRAILNDFNFEVVKSSKPDCFYRQNSFNNEKKKYFYELSIKGRIYFIKEIHSLIKMNVLPAKNERQLIENLRRAYILLIKKFFIVRIKEFKLLFQETLGWTKEVKIISAYDYFLINTLGKLWLSNNYLIKWFKIKGLLSLLIK